MTNQTHNLALKAASFFHSFLIAGEMFRTVSRAAVRHSLAASRGESIGSTGETVGNFVGSFLRFPPVARSHYSSIAGIGVGLRR